jgi:hypothetical protein
MIKSMQKLLPIDKTATEDNLNEHESSDFVGVERKKIKRLYLGGVRLGTSIETN